MGLLKRKEEKTETIAVRVPASLKTQLEELRDRADAAGFDLTATIAESITRLAKQVREELESSAAQPKANRAGGGTHANGLTRAGGEHFPAASGSGGKEN